jgi:PhoH-like ATPase
MAKKTYVIDTSAYLTDANAIYSYGNNDIVVPLKVLEEIDNHKKRQDSVGVNARHIIRIFDALREKGNLNAGVRLQKGKGIVSVKGCDPSLIPCDLEVSRADHIIIATALTEQAVDPARKVIVVTRDINMRVICDSLALSCEDYSPKQIVKSGESIYSGFSEILVDEQIVDRFYDGEKIVLEEDLSKDLFANQMIMMISSANEKKTALARFNAPHQPLKTLEHNRSGAWGIKPRNKEQVYALEILMDPSIPVVSLIGKAGSGKTLCAIAAGLEQILNAKMAEQPEGQKKERRYKRLIVSRPVQPLGKDIGFLPGTMEEKMTPWLMPIQDNLQYLMGDDKSTLEMYMEKGLIEIEALTYIRGRSISNAFIIIDEAQNLTAHEIKTILTRVGEGTKIVFTGDIEQIDNVYVDSTTNGLTYAVELLKEYDLTGHITLKRGERSNVATLAAKIL